MASCIFCKIAETFYISQGSVATQYRCGGIFNKCVTANLPQSMSVKEFLKSVDIWWRYKQKFGGMFFWLTVYVLIGVRVLSTPLEGVYPYTFEDTPSYALPSPPVARMPDHHLPPGMTCTLSLVNTGDKIDFDFLSPVENRPRSWFCGLCGRKNRLCGRQNRLHRRLKSTVSKSILSPVCMRLFEISQHVCSNKRYFIWHFFSDFWGLKLHQGSLQHSPGTSSFMPPPQEPHCPLLGLGLHPPCDSSHTPTCVYVSTALHHIKSNQIY